MTKYRLRRETYKYSNPMYFLERAAQYEGTIIWIPEAKFSTYDAAAFAFRERTDEIKTSEVILES